MSDIYAELARLNLNTEQRSSLLYYFTENGEAETKANKAFAGCPNDEDKHAYLNLVLKSCMCLVISSNIFCSFILMKCATIVSEKSRSTEIESVNLVTGS